VIPLELFIGDREHRSREGLCHRLALRPASGRRRIAIIDDADWMNREGANSLLKTLEEPPPRSILILVGTSEQRQLPTIRSRCQIVRFQPLATSLVRNHLQNLALAESGEELDKIAEIAGGSLDLAQEFANSELRQFSDELAGQLRQTNVDSLSAAKNVQTFVEAAGRDAPSRRRRLRQLIRLRIHLLRDDVLQITSQQPSTGIRHAAELDIVLERLDRCLTALQEIDGNANLSTLIECWIDDDQQAAVRRPSPSRH
jgi:DNA polymerase-3 subunit delta'